MQSTTATVHRYMFTLGGLQSLGQETANARARPLGCVKKAQHDKTCEVQVSGSLNDSDLSGPASHTEMVTVVGLRYHDASTKLLVRWRIDGTLRGRMECDPSQIGVQDA